MKKILLVSLIIGVLLGITQLYVVREVKNTKFQKPPDWCKLAFTNSPVCFPSEAATNYRRGFPLNAVDNSYERLPNTLEPEYIIDFLIFALGIPLLALLAHTFIHRRMIS